MANTKAQLSGPDTDYKLYNSDSQAEARRDRQTNTPNTNTHTHVLALMLPAISCGVRQMLPSNTIVNSSYGNGNENGMLGTKGDCF